MDEKMLARVRIDPSRLLKMPAAELRAHIAEIERFEQNMKMVADAGVIARRVSLLRDTAAEIEEAEEDMRYDRQTLEQLVVLREFYLEMIPVAVERENLARLQALFAERERLVAALQAKWEQTYLPAATALAELIDMQNAVANAGAAFGAWRWQHYGSQRLEAPDLGNFTEVPAALVISDVLERGFYAQLRLPGVWPRPRPPGVSPPEEPRPAPGPALMRGSELRRPGTPAPAFVSPDGDERA